MVFLNVKYQVNGIPQDLHVFKLGFINMLLVQNMNISSSFDEQTKELIDYMAKKINVNDMNSQIADYYLFDSGCSERQLLLTFRLLAIIFPSAVL